MEQIQHILIVNSSITALFIVIFILVSIEVKNLKKLGYFSLVMGATLLVYIMSFLELNETQLITRLIVPLLYFSLGFMIAKGFGVLRFKTKVITSMVVGNLILLISGILFSSIFSGRMVYYRILLMLSLTVFNGLLVVVLLQSLKKLAHTQSHLITLRTLLLLPFMGATFAILINQFAYLLGNPVSNELELFNLYYPLAIISLGFCITLEAAANSIKLILMESDTDELTGVPNRNHFTKTVKSFIVNSQVPHEEVYLAVIVVDSFDDIIEKFGQHSEDVVLKQIAQTIYGSIRGTDSFGRLSNQEFGLLFQCATQQDAKNFIERLRKKVEGLTIKEQNQNIGATVSIGIAGLGNHIETTFASLYKRADRALYFAKQQGQNSSEFEKI